MPEPQDQGHVGIPDPVETPVGGCRPRAGRGGVSRRHPTPGWCGPKTRPLSRRPPDPVPSAAADQRPAKDLPDHAESHGYVLGLADGLGGHVAGALASRLAIHTGLAAGPLGVQLGADARPERGQPADGSICANILSKSIGRSSADGRPAGLDGMATTLTVAYSVGWQAFVVHVGDSRVLPPSWRRAGATDARPQVAQSLADSGLISGDEAAPPRQAARADERDLRPPRDTRPDVTTHSLTPGDDLLLCTDGLHDLVQDSESPRRWPTTKPASGVRRPDRGGTEPGRPRQRNRRDGSIWGREYGRGQTLDPRQAANSRPVRPVRRKRLVDSWCD